ncbi:MAG TPA: hypothetical protein VKP58_16930 [Candidatus Acidoferrum sp.]|nr:hypothetical protein [Candidatus Acidoferrum sp.]
MTYTVSRFRERMAEFSVWGGLSLIMLLLLLAIISSTALLVGAVSAVQQQHVTWHGFIAIAVALILAAANFFSVQRVGLSLAGSTGVNVLAARTYLGCP